MKCPYRKVTVQSKIMGDRTKTEEYFGDCYKEECPCYVPERHFNNNIFTTEYCIKVDQKNEDVKS